MLRIRIVRSLIVFDKPSEMAGSDVDDFTFNSQYIYDRIKAIYHMDVTHEGGNGLQCVEADDFRSALLKILCQFRIDKQWGDVRERYNSPPPRVNTVMSVIGRMRYGKAFLEEYSDILPKPVVMKYRDYFDSNIEFLESMSRYIHDDYAARLAVNGYMLNRSVTWMTHVVIALTYVSAVFGSYVILGDMSIVPD